MTDGTSLEFKIGLLGPTAVGKTSLVTTLLDEANNLLERTPVRVEAEVGSPTAMRIHKHRNELRAAIIKKSFESGALRGTTEPAHYELAMRVKSHSIGMKILDFPGGWMREGGPPPDKLDKWKACREFISDSSVLMLPTDAAVLMESVTGKERGNIPATLCFSEVQELVDVWAKNRSARREREPALLVIAPLKCEAYFADNGGHRERGKELQASVLKHYRDVIDSAKRVAEHVTVLYAPVDTYGCVELKKAQWETGLGGEARFRAEYRVRKDDRVRIKGADAILVEMCRQIVDVKRRVEQQRSQTADQRADAARFRAAQQPDGLWERFVWWLGDERDKRNAAASASAADAAEVRRSFEELQVAVQQLADREPSSRSTKL